MLDGRKIDGDRSPEPPECIDDCIVLDEVGAEEEEAKDKEAEGTAPADTSDDTVPPGEEETETAPEKADEEPTVNDSAVKTEEVKQDEEEAATGESQTVQDCDDAEKTEGESEKSAQES